MYAGLTFIAGAHIHNHFHDIHRTHTTSIKNSESIVTFTFTSTNVHTHTWLLMAEHTVWTIMLSDSDTEAQSWRKRKPQNTYCILYEETGDWKREDCTMWSKISHCDYILTFWNDLTRYINKHRQHEAGLYDLSKVHTCLLRKKLYGF